MSEPACAHRRFGEPCVECRTTQRGFVYRDGEVPPLTDEARQELADLGHVCQHDQPQAGASATEHELGGAS